MLSYLKNLVTFVCHFIFIVEDNSSNTTKIDNNLYQVHYKIRGKEYKCLVIPSRLPDNILGIYTDSGCDITDEIRPFLNHNRNFTTNKLEQIYSNESIHIINIDGTTENYNL